MERRRGGSAVLISRRQFGITIVILVLSLILNAIGTGYSNSTLSRIDDQTSPKAIAERRAASDEFLRSLGETVDCNNADRLDGLARSIEGLLHLPSGSIFIKPCDSMPISPTTTLPNRGA